MPGYAQILHNTTPCLYFALLHTATLLSQIPVLLLGKQWSELGLTTIKRPPKPPQDRLKQIAGRREGAT